MVVEAAEEAAAEAAEVAEAAAEVAAAAGRPPVTTHPLLKGGKSHGAIS